MVQHYMGKDSYVWWMGIVENRKDPLKIGRCQVRIYGWNTASKALLPTEELLWAHPVLPLNSTDISPPKEGMMVKGFYMDGEAGQFPIIEGIVPSIPDQTTNPSHGFSDPRSPTDLQNAPSPPKNVIYHDDGTGVNIQNSVANRYPNILNEPTTSRIARNENIDSTIIGRINQNIQGSEQKLAYNAKYPYNHVIETESGHVTEIDDTPGAERLTRIHRTGTYEEIKPDGSRTLKILGTNYELILKNHNIEIFGDCNITINGNANITTKKNITISYELATLNGNIQLNGSLTATGDIIGNNISLDNHTHSGVIQGLNKTGLPIPSTI